MNQQKSLQCNQSTKNVNMPSASASQYQLYINGNCIYPQISNDTIRNLLKNEHYLLTNSRNHPLSNQNLILKNIPNIIRKSKQFFTADEDNNLKDLVKHFGTKNWLAVSLFMNGRSAKQCRDRYMNYLIPGVFQGEWTKEEDELLIKLHNEFGPKWSLIKNQLPNRSSNAIKNRWSYFLQKKKKNEQIDSSKNKDEDQEKDQFSDVLENFDIFENKYDDFDFDFQASDNLNWFTSFTEIDHFE